MNNSKTTKPSLGSAAVQVGLVLFSTALLFGTLRLKKA